MELKTTFIVPVAPMTWYATLPAADEPPTPDAMTVPADELNVMDADADVRSVACPKAMFPTSVTATVSVRALDPAPEVPSAYVEETFAIATSWPSQSPQETATYTIGWTVHSNTA